MAEHDPAAAALAAASEADRPESHPWLDWIWTAWNRLSDERPSEVIGMAMAMGGMSIRSKPLRIPWTSVLAWSRYHGHSPDDLAFLDHCICEMDTEYMNWWAEQQKQAA